MAELQTGKVDRYHYRDYLSRAVQCFHAAKQAEVQSEYDACAINAIQSAISAADALATFKKAERNASPSHDDAVRLFRSIDPQDASVQENANRLGRILTKKNVSAYEEKSVKPAEAQYLLTEADRLLTFVKSRLPT